MYGLTDKSFNELIQILASIPEIEEALIYGSRARGDYWRASDVDLSIKGKDFTQHNLAHLNDQTIRVAYPPVLRYSYLRQHQESKVQGQC